MEAFTIALGVAVVQGLTEISKDLLKPFLEPAQEQIEQAVQRGYKKAKKDQALQRAIQKALEAADAPLDDDDALLAWGQRMGLARLQAENAATLRRVVARSVIGFTDPQAPPPDELLTALRWPRSRADNLAALLGALREQLAALDDWQPLIAYADEQAQRGLLQETLAQTSLLASTVTFSPAGNALRVQLVERLGLDEAQILEVEGEYRRLVQNAFRMHIVTGLTQVDKAVRLPLDEIYLELGLTPFKEQRESEEDLLNADVETRLKRAMRQVEQRVSGVLAESRRLVIVGKPGSGKTTSLKYIAYMLALGEAGAARLGLDAPYLPVYVRLAEFADALQQQSTLSLEKFLQEYLAAQYPGAPHQEDFLRTALQKSACMVLLDGMDEVGDVGDRLIDGQTLREVVLKRVQQFAEQRCQPEHGNRIVVTSRLEGYHSGNLAGFTEAELSALRLPEEVEDFLQRWFTAYIHEHDPALTLAAAAAQARRERVEPLMRSIMRSASIQLLAINPLLLTILAVIYETRNTPLPERRAELYDIVAQTLVKNWRRAQTEHESRIHQEITANDIYFLMAQLAYWLHEQRPGGAMPLTDWQEKVRALLIDLVDEDDLDAFVEEFLHHAREETGLLTERSPGHIGFFHLTLEEYLAAVEIARQDTDQRVKMLQKHWRNTRWQETLLLVAGELQRRGNRNALEAYLNALLNLEAEREEQLGRPAYLAGRALADVGARSVGRRLREAVREALRETAQDRHPETKAPDPQGKIPPRMRAAAADILDELGYLHPDLYRFVRLDDGQQTTDDGRQTADNRPPSTVHIGMFPVTNAQYARFLQAPDFADPDLWRNFPKFDEHGRPMDDDWGDAGLQWLNRRSQDKNGMVYPRYWHDPRLGIARPSAPVVGVSWYEANAYCRWLARHWDELEEARANPELSSTVHGPSSLIVRLPTEAEWLAAAGVPLTPYSLRSESPPPLGEGGGVGGGARPFPVGQSRRSDAGQKRDSPPRQCAREQHRAHHPGVDLPAGAQPAGRVGPGRERLGMAGELLQWHQWHAGVARRVLGRRPQARPPRRPPRGLPVLQLEQLRVSGGGGVRPFFFVTLVSATLYSASLKGGLPPSGMLREGQSPPAFPPEGGRVIHGCANSWSR